ncbi:hypothetical protein Naga_101926g1, partial [Nannochloropsis gaditana]
PTSLDVHLVFFPLIFHAPAPCPPWRPLSPAGFFRSSRHFLGHCWSRTVGSCLCPAGGFSLEEEGSPCKHGREREVPLVRRKTGEKTENKKHKDMEILLITGND